MSNVVWYYNVPIMDIAGLKNSPDKPILNNKNIRASMIEWIRVIVIALAIALPVRYFIAEPFIVSGASMDPTFATGQFLIVDRLSYRFEKPQRGDVIIFQSPTPFGPAHAPKIYYIKRIIGLPGETLHISDGNVTVTNPSDVAFTKKYPQGLVVDSSYVDSGHASHDTFATTTLGATDYFVMGDNRAESSDSRAWGQLDADFIVGRPILRLLPLPTLSVWPGEHRE